MQFKSGMIRKQKYLINLSLYFFAFHFILFYFILFYCRKNLMCIIKFETDGLEMPGGRISAFQYVWYFNISVWSCDCFSKSIPKSYCTTFAAPVPWNFLATEKIDGDLIIQKLLYSKYSQIVRFLAFITPLSWFVILLILIDQLIDWFATLVNVLKGSAVPRSSVKFKFIQKFKIWQERDTGPQAERDRNLGGQDFQLFKDKINIIAVITIKDRTNRI